MFLFSDSRCNYANGKIMVQTEFPFYEPGNLVKGKIYIRVDAPIMAKYIDIEIKGKEKAAFTRFWYESEGDRQVERSERVKMDKRFLEYKQPIFAVNGVLNPGSYEVDFSF